MNCIWTLSICVCVTIVGMFPFFWCRCAESCAIGLIVAWIQSLVGGMSLCVAILALKWGRSQWLYDKDCKRVGLTTSLINLLESIEKDLDSKDWQIVFWKLSQVAYALDHEMLSAVGASYLDVSMRNLMCREEVSNAYRNIDPKRKGFDSLFKFVAENCPDCGCGDERVSGAADSDGNIRGVVTKEELDRIPCVVIRLSRLYRAGMSADEMYQATQGYWRINLDKARKAKYAICVAEGAVQEVYKIDTWHSIDGNELSTRKRFEGSVADDAVANNLRNRSVSGLFAHGDQYPVRYFGI